MRQAGAGQDTQSCRRLAGELLGFVHDEMILLDPLRKQLVYRFYITFMLNAIPVPLLMRPAGPVAGAILDDQSDGAFHCSRLRWALLRRKAA
ncbi:MAG: hypothetical protein SVO96_09990 [Pseudomonadota bacterium]|nr:hypothetical protein [Pseudomonadota bacterium]